MDAHSHNSDDPPAVDCDECSTRSETAAQFEDETLMVAAFTGWNDAASAATTALAHISEALEGRLLDELDMDPYVDYQVNRPTTILTGHGRKLLWPTTRIDLVSSSAARRNLILVHGVEPSMRWRSYYQEILDLARTFKCQGIVLLGSLLADVSHNTAPNVEVHTDNIELQKNFSIGASSYEGPTGIVGVLAQAAEQDGLPTVSMWAPVPHYAPSAVAHSAALGIVSALEDVLGIAIPHRELTELAQDWKQTIQSQVDSDQELTQYVRALENAISKSPLPQATGDAIAREFERYLRRGDPPE